MAAETPHSPAGHYKAEFVDRGKPGAITLDCSSQTHCVFNFSAEPPMETSTAHPVVDLRQAGFALGYAAEHADAPRSPTDWPFVERLAPLLHASPEIDRCWDIGGHDPDYLLACRLRSGGHSDPRMFVFVTVLAGCGPRSCRFEIIPMDELPR